ncbi:hypothetical protein [Blastococcus sp. SYSU DS0619]
MSIQFTAPIHEGIGDRHHGAAAAGNFAAAEQAVAALTDALSEVGEHDKVLLRAAAGAGKSFALVRMVKEALEHKACARVAITAFANKQVFPLAGRLGDELGADRVCLFVATARQSDVPPEVRAKVTIAVRTTEIPASAEVVLGTSHKLGAFGERGRLMNHLGASANGDRIFDVLLVDEAWQLALHRFNAVEGLAPLVVGVGDVGQLPPLDPGQNPWRGDPGYNPYRAWPTAYEDKPTTFVVDLPAVWRPAAEQLPLWRAFYNDWDELDSVAGPGDRSLELPLLTGPAGDVWSAVATGRPTLLEVEGLDEPDAADIDPPLLGVLEELLFPLLEAGFAVNEREYDDTGQPKEGVRRVESWTPTGDPLIVILATRNQAVDDAAEIADRLTEKLSLPDGVIQASTVDSWQGQTNRLTVAVHPLSGASKLDDFNSAFGRLAVTCTRATHGLLMVARAGLDDLLVTAPPRPGTPFGEPGPRSLPRQTHQRILGSFTRGTWQYDGAPAVG